jgi:hypothetical protein
MQPTFYFSHTQHGIITSTFPVLRKLASGDDYPFYDISFDEAVKNNYWYPYVEFVFTPISDTKDLGFEPIQLLPFAYGEPKRQLDYSPLKQLEGAPIFWGGLIEGDIIEHLKLVGNYFLNQYGYYKDWYDSTGQEALAGLWNWYHEELIKTLNENERTPDNSWNDAFDNYSQYREWREQ